MHDIVMSSFLTIAATHLGAIVAKPPPQLPAGVTTWAGILNFPPHAVNQSLNVTVADAAGGAFSTASFQWTWDKTNGGAPCVPNSETLVWTTDAASRTVFANGSACGSGQSFYSFAGTMSGDGLTLHGTMSSDAGHRHLPGTWRIVKGAPQVGPTNACGRPRPSPSPAPVAPDFPQIWPRPKSVSRGSSSIVLSSTFAFTASSSTPVSPALAAAFQRFRTICFGAHTVSGVQAAGTAAAAAAQSLLSGIEVTVNSVAPLIIFGMNESYTLNITTAGRAQLVAETLAGAYHGLESFSQLLAFDFATGTYVIRGAPVVINDAPRFAWRELMVDMSRHFLPVRALRDVVDSMTTAKLNVLHLHLVDSESFALNVPSRPQLVQGAFSAYEQYTMQDLADIKQYAAARYVQTTLSFP